MKFTIFFLLLLAIICSAEEDPEPEYRGLRWGHGGGMMGGGNMGGGRGGRGRSNMMRTIHYLVNNHEDI